MGKDERFGWRVRSARAGSWLASARIAVTLLVAVAAYAAGAADAAAVRWAAVASTVFGIALLGFLLRQRLHHEERREELLQTILDSVPHILFYKDAGSRYLGVNQVFERTFGVRAEEVIGKRDAELFGQALHDRFVAQDRELLATGEARTFDEEMSVDGTNRYIESRKTPFYDARGNAVGIVGVAMDVTERRHLRERFEENNARLNVALRASRMGTWTWDVESDEVELDAFERALLHVPEDARTGFEVFSRMHPEDAGPVRAAVLRALGEGTVVDFEFRAPDHQGGWRWIEGFAAPHCLPGRPAFVVGVNRDITERKRQQLELTEAKRRAEYALAELEQSRIDLELALRSGQLGVWRSEYRDVSEASRMEDPRLDDPIEWDANVRRIFGRGSDERVTRRQFFDALHPQDRERVLDHLAEVARRGGDYADQYRIIRPDGKTRVVAVHATPVSRTDPDTGAIQWMTGIARDITEEENLKADLRQKAHEAQMASEAKARFLAMMSHEIRTPMNGVVGMIELLAETPLSPEQQQMLRTCKDSALGLLTIINDILDFSKIEAGKLELDNARLSLRRLVESVGEALGSHASQRGIDLDVHVTPDVPRRVMGDRVRLRQILTNLIGNAIKFTERGGVAVNVSLEPHAVGAGRVHVRFDVIDSGIGMSEDTVHDLFQPFQQADAATTRRFGGTGLGLSIVKHLTDLMGGRVECESRPSQGSRFSVVIPFELASAGRRDWGYSIAGARVFALASNARRREILAEFLEQFEAGVEFFDAADALFSRARDAVVQGGIDVVLLDRGWSLAEHTGLRRRFSEDPYLSRLPFVMVRTRDQVQAQPIAGTVLVGGNPLTRPGLIHGIAVALGRASPLVPAMTGEHLDESGMTALHEREEAAGRLVLLAEDNPTNCEVIARQLARLGYACDVAEDGEQAWAMLRAAGAESRYALLLTDCHMPLLDGYQLTERIRRHERDRRAPALPIVAITANALQGEGERCLAMGMNGYLAKPLQIRELKRMLAEFLPREPANEPVDFVPEAGVGKAGFPALARVLGGDEERLRRVLDVFERTTRSDIDQLDAAHAAGDGPRVRDLAHKLKSGCRQLGEADTGRAFDAVERTACNALQAATFEHEFAIARDGLRRLLARVSAYLADDTGGPDHRTQDGTGGASR